MIEFYPDINSLEFDPDQIILEMGYNSNNIPFPYVKIFEEIFNEAKKVIKPRCGFILVTSAKSYPSEGIITLKDVVFNTKKIIAHPLKYITEAALYVGTVGEEFDFWLESKKNIGDPLIEYLSNLIGSSIAESIAQWVYNQIKLNVQKRGLTCSNRYSPGYCGWSVEEQNKLFKFFPKDFCGVELTDSALMIPIKSTSGMVGIGKDVEWTKYPCEVCNVPHCYKNNMSYAI